MQNPLVSIILPTYNGSKYISKSIESVLNQTYSNFELIIINDASNDNVEQIILDYMEKNSRIIYIRNEQNLERSKTKNKGVKLSNGDFIAFIDDDDIWKDNKKLKKQVDFLKQNIDYGLIGTNAITVDENDIEIGKIIVKENDIDIKNNILITNQFIQSSVLIRKEIFSTVGGFNENLNLCEDYDLWLRICQVTKSANLDDFSVQYLIRSNSTTSKNLLKMKSISIKLIFIYRKYYSNFYIAIIIKLITFFLPITYITKIIKKIKD